MPRDCRCCRQLGGAAARRQKTHAGLEQTVEQLEVILLLDLECLLGRRQDKSDLLSRLGFLEEDRDADAVERDRLVDRVLVKRVGRVSWRRRRVEVILLARPQDHGNGSARTAANNVARDEPGRHRLEGQLLAGQRSGRKVEVGGRPA